MSNKNDGIVEKLWEVFSSMKTGLVLLGVVAVVSGIGTLVPQKSLDPEGAMQVAEIWRKLGFTNIYVSPLFQFLLGLLCINLIVCSIQRFGGIYKLTYRPEAPQDVANIPQKIQAKIQSKDKETLKRDTLALLKKKGFHITLRDEEGKWSFLAQKRRMGNWGSFISHISFVILIIGALIGSLWGFKGYMLAGEGQVVPIQEIELYKGKIKENFLVKINSVEDRILPSGERDNWYTDISILEGGTEVHRQTISVNHPLTFKGITFYQANYSPGAKFTVEMDGEKIPLSLQNHGGYFNFPGTHLIFALAAMKVDPNEPVILYQVFDHNMQIQMGQLELGESASIADTYSVTFDGATAFTGLQVKADPGVWVVWLGSGLLILGLALSFYWRPVRIAGFMDGEGPLTIGAYSGKFNMGAKEEFEKIVKELES